MAILLPFSFAACDQTEPDEVVSYEICQSFKELVIFQGGEVEFDGYYFDIHYKSGKVETIPITEDNLFDFSTEKLGEHEFFVLVGSTKYTFTYVVHEVVPVAGTYKGETVTFYVGEEPDLTNIEVWILYSNADERIISASELACSAVDYTLTGQSKVLVVSLGDIDVNIPYVVTCRPIEQDVIYEIDDEHSAKLVNVSGANHLYFYEKLANGSTNLQYDATLEGEIYNRYTFSAIVSGEFVDYLVYLSGEKLVVTRAA